MGSHTGTLLAVIVAVLLGSCIAGPRFFQEFSGSDWQSKFVRSSDPKYNGELVAEIPDGWTQPGLKVPEKARFYGYAANVGKPINPSKGLVLQFELKLADSLSCGGAYLKFLTASAALDASGLVEDTPYVVMFGPDKCGSTNKVHLIIKHKAPNGDIEEKHLKLPPSVLLDSDTHVYTAVLDPTDNTYQVLIDGDIKKSGSLFEDFEPSFNPPEEIDDPEDKKPSDWVDESRIPDPEASKPEDWDEDAPKDIEDVEAEKPEGWLDDEPAEIADPEAEKPDDWDDEEDGEWEPSTIPNPKCAIGCGEWKRPMIPNPDFKGKWTAPFVDNPAYKGVWAPQKIANPNYFLDESPLSNIGEVGGVALEIWTMDSNYYFDNILIDNDPAVAEEYRTKYWAPKQAAEAKINEEKAAKEAELAKESEPQTENAVTAFIRDTIDQALTLPGLSALRKPLQPVLDIIDDNNYAAIGFAALILTIPLFILIQLIPKGKKPVASARRTVEAKKKDVTSADDKPKVATTTTTSEVVEDDGDEDEGKTVRRRVRRET